MKKWIVPLALLMLAVPVLSHAQSDGHWVWRPLEFRSTLTSSTSPTYASQFGSGTNPGTRTVDSLTFMMSNLTVTATTGVVAQAGLADTSVGFQLTNWIPGRWAQADTTFGHAGTTSIATPLSRPALSLPADSALALVVAWGPAVNNVSGATLTGDSSIVILEGSVNGTSWVQITNAPGVRQPEVGTANSYFATFYTSGKVLPNQGAAANLIAWPLLRVRIFGDESASGLGDYQARYGYNTARRDSDK